MKIFSICDSEELYCGLRLAGIEGAVVHTDAEFKQIYDEAVSDPDIGILILGKNFNITERPTMPLIVKIGD